MALEFTARKGAAPPAEESRGEREGGERRGRGETRRGKGGGEGGKQRNETHKVNGKEEKGERLGGKFVLGTVRAKHKIIEFKGTFHDCTQATKASEHTR